MTMRSILDWRETQVDKALLFEPQVLSKAQWPPDYNAIWNWRIQMLKRLKDNPSAQEAARAYYSTRPKEFIMHWMDTYDPRRAENKWIPFIMFERQAQMIDFFDGCVQEQEGGLVEKCRDAGATWLACGYSDWRWIFIHGDAIGWGSRKEDLLDQSGNLDSIFEKMRKILDRLPAFWLPEGFNLKKYSTHMKIVNPVTGATITGEAGDNIGRGGRKSLYFKDEAAHYERPEKIEAALGDNTNVQIDISSVNGLGNVFHRRAENAVLWTPDAPMPKGYVRKFIMDWRDHPLKTQEWYDTRRAKYEREGMLHVFAQEVDRDYSGAIQNTIIPYDHIRSAIDAHLKVPYIKAAYDKMNDHWIAGLDVADEGGDRNALTLRQWIVWRHCEEWGERDPGVTARRAILGCRPFSKRIKIMYDCIGVGAGVKSEYNRLTQDEKLINASELPFVPWNAGASVLNPYERVILDDRDSLMNKDYYGNLKAQGWGNIARRFYKTYMAVTQGVVYPVDELISLDSAMPLLDQLCKELAQPTRTQSSRLLMLVEKKPDGTKSPNLADSGIMAYNPVPDNHSNVIVGQYGY